MTNTEAQIYRHAAALIELHGLKNGEVRVVVQDGAIVHLIVSPPGEVVFSARVDRPPTLETGC